jgi:hypothetical protein
MSGAGQGALLRIGVIGYAFMGAAHAQAWRNAPRFFDLPLRLELSSVAGRDADAVRAAANRLGFTSSETDWRRLVERDDIDLIDICTPGDSHFEIAIAALQAGKHVMCEKPLANTVGQAEQMAAAARAAAERGIWAMCGFTLSAHASPRPGPAAGRSRPDRYDPAGAGAVPAGLAHRPGCPDDLAAGQSQIGVRRPRRSRCAPGRHCPMAHRAVDHRRLRNHGDVRDVAATER